MKKVVIVMTYFNRQYQLNKTLETISKSKHDNFEVVIVDDVSEKKVEISKTNYPCHVERIEPKEKWWKDSTIPFNRGIQKALKLNPQIIIVQNAECFHVGDVITYADLNSNENNYLAFSCFSLDQNNTFLPNIDEKLNDIVNVNNKGINENGTNAWYNHPQYRNCAYHFCSAITTQNLIRLNGFDERFSGGIAFEDNDFITRIRKLKLKIEIPVNPFVVHQWHYYKTNPIENSDFLYQKNAYLFDKLAKDGNIYAEHIVTSNFINERK
jgi:glycosyltransferase involved in cell wall biosynthesis